MMTMREVHLGSACALTMIALAALTAGCAAHRAAVPGPDLRVGISPDKPPSAKSWPRYPTFPARSCWARPFPTSVMRSAPSFLPKPPARPPSSQQIVRRLLKRFGDRRYVRRITIGPPPPITVGHLRAWYAGARPPADARWAYISAPEATANPPPDQAMARLVAEWEVYLVAGALRDDFCAAGGHPLVGWSLNGTPGNISSRQYAFGQRFPNPSPQAFRRRAALVGRRYGFRVVSQRLLRPRQLAPLVVVETSRDRKEFVGDVPTILSLLDPMSDGVVTGAWTFEGFFLDVRDAKGRFFGYEIVTRGEIWGGAWSWDPCVNPYSRGGIPGQCPR